MTELKVTRGDDKTWNLTFLDANKVAIDLTGAAIFFTVKINKADADSEALISVKQTTHTDPTGGLTSITITSSDTDIKVENYYYDFQLVDAGGLVTTVLTGIFKVVQDITTKVV